MKNIACECKGGNTVKIVVLDGYTENPGDLSWQEFQKLGEMEIYDYTSNDEICSRIVDAEVVLTNKTPLSHESIERANKLRYIGVLATGYNVVDVETATQRGIIVTNIPTYGTYSVAQYVFALLLEICHHVGHHAQAVKAGRWTKCRDFCFWDYPLIELYGKTMGIIGYGRIGKQTAEIAHAFGMHVLAYDKYADADNIVELDELYKKSDVISLHCPLTKDNALMINNEAISKMKTGVILVNTSRGALVDEDALARALKTGKVYAAACDVVSSEPIQQDNPLLNVDNCLITPHIAWASQDSRQRLMDIAVDNLKAFLSGEAQNAVNVFSN